MGLFGLFKKKKKTQPQEESMIANDKLIPFPTTLDESESMSSGGHLSFIRTNCEEVLEASRQSEELKIEYEAVTSYLNDIQKLDQVPEEDKDILLETAEIISKLTKERTNYQNSENIKISNSQFKHIEQYESEIPDEIKKLQGYEAYNSVIKTDMRHLEGEKGALIYRKNEIIYQQKYLKKLAVITSILVFTMFSLFYVIGYIFKKDMLIPFILTILMAAASSVYIFYESRKNQHEVKVVESKLSRAVGFMNKVKIKYVNNTSCIDYAYSKFMVKSAVELIYLWEQYQKAKEEEKRYRKNTELLHHYNEVLIDEMKGFKLADPEIWIYQTDALNDSREMVEIRHRLNVRRQKLREQIDYNNEVRNNGLNGIRTLLEQKSDLKGDIIAILSEYNIHI